MKEVALALVRDLSDPLQKLNLLREVAQAMVLRSLHESEAFLCLSLVGGTALRFVHSLPRFSEDLDFSLERADGYHPEKWMKKVKTDLSLAGFDVQVSWSDKATVHESWIRIAGLLQDAELAVMPEQKLSIKLKIDSRPPAGAVTETGIVNRHALLSLRTHDLPSLMAGKVHALLTRKYAKGRDWYDLVWYLAKRPPTEPNTEQLRNSLVQTQSKQAVTALPWKMHLTEKIRTLDPDVLIRDVRPFLERPEESELLTREHFLSVL